MKAILLVICLLLASTLFIPSPTLARQLADKGAVTPGTKDPNKPAVPCTGNRYGSCLPNPPKKCSPYVRNC